MGINLFSFGNSAYAFDEFLHGSVFQYESLHSGAYQVEEFLLLGAGTAFGFNKAVLKTPQGGPPSTERTGCATFPFR